MATGYCSTLGIITATRAPRDRPWPCSQPANPVASLSSSPYVMRLSMQTNASRSRNCAMAASKSSTHERYLFQSTSAGTPAG